MRESSNGRQVHLIKIFLLDQSRQRTLSRDSARSVELSIRAVDQPAPQHEHHHRSSSERCVIDCADSMEDLSSPASPISSHSCCSVPSTCTLIVVASKVPMYGEMTGLGLIWAHVNLATCVRPSHDRTVPRGFRARRYSFPRVRWAIGATYSTGVVS